METLLVWLFKGLEIVLAGVFGLLVYSLLTLIFSQFWAICGLSIILYFFSGIISPYIDRIRKWLYTKITGIDKEEF